MENLSFYKFYISIIILYLLETVLKYIKMYLNFNALEEQM